MLRFTKGNTETVYLTLTEKQTITSPNYLFIFDSRITNEKIKFVVLGSADQSNFKSRFNQFAIVVNTYFAAKDEGWYKYTVREQASETNTDESASGAIIETGLMFLSDGEDVTTTKYNNTTNYKVYDAQ